MKTVARCEDGASQQVVAHIGSCYRVALSHFEMDILAKREKRKEKKKSQFSFLKNSVHDKKSKKVCVFLYYFCVLQMSFSIAMKTIYCIHTHHPTQCMQNHVLTDTPKVYFSIFLQSYLGQCLLDVQTSKRFAIVENLKGFVRDLVCVPDRILTCLYTGLMVLFLN